MDNNKYVQNSAPVCQLPNFHRLRLTEPMGLGWHKSSPVDGVAVYYHNCNICNYFRNDHETIMMANEMTSIDDKLILTSNIISQSLIFIKLKQT